MSTFNIFVEFIEIFITQILYLRRVYTRQIFRKHKAYALPVFCIIYPPLQAYLKSSLKTVQHLLQTNQLKKIEVLIYNETERESFVIDITGEFSIPDSDKFLISTHEIFRYALYDLENKCKALKKFSRQSMFKIQLHTNEKAYQKLCNEKLHQDFLWIKDERVGEVEADEDSSLHNKVEKKILPLSSSKQQTFMSLYVEQFSQK